MKILNGHTETQHHEDVLEALETNYHLVVWNDDVNTFDWVIETLMEVCGHEREQAEQCALLIHFNGKCSVKTGEFNTLRPMCDAILDRGIQATVEDATN